MKKSFFRTFIEDSGVYLIPTLLSQGIAFFLIPLYTRILTPSDYGVIDMIKTFSSLACLVVALEISQAYCRFFPDAEDSNEKKEISSTSFTITLINFFLFLIICQLFTSPMSKVLFGKPGLDIHFRIGTLYIAMMGVSLLINTQFRFELKKMHYVYNSIILFLVTAVFSVLLAYVFKMGLLGMILALLIGQFSALVIGIWQQRLMNSFSINTKLLKKMLIFSIPLVPSGIAVFISGYISRIMINHYLSLNEVGLYGMGFRIASVSILLIAGVNRSLTPLIYNHYKDKETPLQIAKTFRVFIILALLLFYVLSAFAPEFLLILTTSKYYESSSTVIYLVPALFLSQMYVFFPGTEIAKKTTVVMWVSIINAILSVLLNWILIPSFGYQGAAVATLIVCLVVFLIYMRISQKYYFIPVDWFSINVSSIIVGCITFMMTLVDLGFYLNIVLKLFIGSCLFVIFYLTNLIKKEEYLKIVETIRSRF